MKAIKFKLVQLMMLVSVGIIICLFSCQENFFEDQFETISSTDSLLLVDDNLQLKKEFARALAKAVGENQEIRDFIKNEALKKFDYDYDILYQLIKDDKLSNGYTFEEILSKYLKPSLLTEVKEKIPTLTIYVPELPMNSFSAETWNSEEEVPFVGIRVKNDCDVPLFNSAGKESVILGGRIPLYPILVIKENERVIVDNSTSFTTRSIQSRGDNTIQFSFLDNVFNNISPKQKPIETCTAHQNSTSKEFITQNRRVASADIPLPASLEKVLDAYNIYENFEGGWQRDYIYYNLTPTNTVGPFNYNFKEYITAFEMVGDANRNLQKISDQSNDPKRNSQTHMKGYTRYTYWTDGEFEFKVKVYLGNKNAFGNELTTYFRVRPTDIFDLDWINDRTDHNNLLITGVKNRRAYLSVPLFEWDLESYSANVKIAIEEVDASETIKQTSTTSAEFAANFGFSTELNKKVKLGLQFGSSAKETRTTSFEISTTYGNDELGEVIVNFWDDIIISNRLVTIPSSLYDRFPTTGTSLDYNQKYSTGWYRLFIAPQQTN